MTPVNQKSRCKGAGGRSAIKNCLINHDESQTVTIDSSCRPAEPEQGKTSESSGSYPSVPCFIYDWLVCSRKEQWILHTHWYLSFLLNILHHTGIGWSHWMAQTPARRTRKWACFGFKPRQDWIFSLSFMFRFLSSLKHPSIHIFCFFWSFPFDSFSNVLFRFFPSARLRLPFFFVCFLSL